MLPITGGSAKIHIFLHPSRRYQDVVVISRAAGHMECMLLMHTSVAMAPGESFPGNSGLVVFCEQYQALMWKSDERT
jgi:hypothetical protein